MNDRQKELIEKLHLNEKDFQTSEEKTVVTDEERINDLEIAICELFDALGNLE